MDETPVNDVRLRGRVSGTPLTRVLPSGDELVSLRVVVPRSATARRRSTATVDTIELTAWTAALRRTTAKLVEGDIIEVTGELRRRFARGASGPQSYMGVDLATCHRVRRAAAAR